ncbi:MAG: O-methyltransferase [Bacteroides sp.]|jgi:caffeoyl-CoA O-methyltransferase|nr:O-methyltransferase [Bacteroides sp.]
MISEKIEKYARQMSDPESPVLQRLSRETQAKVLKPRMLSGHLQGKLLEMISLIHRPRRVLEVGTYTGYSAICLAQGLTSDGLLHTIDHNPELEDFARHFFTEAGLEHKIIQHIGEALDMIARINETFDLVFIDADKENYVTYFEMVIDRMPSGGLILADNVLWDGKVLNEPAPNDPETQGIIRFNQHIRDRQGVQKILLPFRDGLSLIRKK